MEIDARVLVEKLRERFPLQLEICVQAIRLERLQAECDQLRATLKEETGYAE